MTNLSFEEELRLFKEFCDIPMLTDEDFVQKLRGILTPKVHAAGKVTDEIVEESFIELGAWVDDHESYEVFKKNKFLEQ